MIEFREVTFIHQNGVKALDDVSLKIEGGQTVAIVGENGAGKTTLVKHITGLLMPTSGSVVVDGEETKSRSTAQLSRKTGVAFQNPDHQLFSESVTEEVAFGLRNFGFSEGEVKERTERALDSFGLSEYAKSSPLTLSGGEKKRLTIACILAWDPSTVVLDEPTVGQDALQKRKLTEVVGLLRSQGKTVVIVSHDIEFLWPMQPRTVVMAKGRVIADGPASEVMLDAARLGEARVSQPQLVTLFQGLKRRPASPFVDDIDALKWAEAR
jgi:energy-coupling factor transport system ATP-binding protein